QLLLSPRDPFDQVVDLLVGDRRPLDELIQLGVDPSAFLRAQLHRADDRCGVVCQERWLSWLPGRRVIAFSARVFELVTWSESKSCQSDGLTGSLVCDA